ncbi:MAG: lysylphosphatidylglycerol synthase transmembrane domain-containing protein [Candidatus Bathyarchaeia archaeon]|jgi:hypothetical protein
MVAILGALVWYAGVNTLLLVIAKTNPFYLLFAFLAYFLINVLFTIRIIRVLERQDIKATFRKTILPQYAGMLTSDVTPGRSGYMLTPVYLMNQNIDPSASLSCILGIQSIEFLVKVLGGASALVFLLYRTNLTREIFTLAIIGIGLMLLGGFVLAAIIWSPRAADLFRKIATSRFFARFTGRIIAKLDEFGKNAMKTRRAIPEIFLITLLSWVLKGFEWFFLGLSLGITNIGWFGFFLLHPLITAFGFVPLTPSGIGFQEGAIVGIFLLLGIDIRLALAFAILSRVLVIFEDLIGVPQIAKSAQRGLLATTRLIPKN